MLTQERGLSPTGPQSQFWNELGKLDQSGEGKETVREQYSLQVQNSSRVLPSSTEARKILIHQFWHLPLRSTRSIKAVIMRDKSDAGLQGLRLRFDDEEALLLSRRLQRRAKILRPIVVNFF